ncbi:MAG: fatty acyl-AMP ligase [Acidobacteriota bacterium]
MSNERPSYPSIVDALEAEIASPSSAPRFTFLADGDEPSGVLTPGDLFGRARRVAAMLEARGARGERVLLVVPERLEFIVAFVGCLMAGAVGVPALPPVNRRTGERLRVLARTSRPRIVLTLESLRGGLEPFLAGEGVETSWCTVEESERSSAEGWRRPPLREDSMALLQYSSGSTGAPKGVMVTHGNLMANCHLLRQASRPGPGARLVSWLPFHHDWGLIGCVVFPIVEQLPCVLFEPSRFLSRPVRWLRAISRFRATISCAPNFAYEMCAESLSLGKESPEGIDLSCWEVAMVGAEPVRWETLERFGAACAPFGFRREGFFPTYGLAEHTLIASGGPPGAGARRLVLRRDALERGRVVPADDAPEGACSLVGCGRPLGPHPVAVMDPVTGRRCATDEVGEIWLHGDSVAVGYWEDPEETRRTFGAELDGESWLRTGDLGFLHDGELFLGGRLKDVIIKAGRNYFAEDVERAAAMADPALRPGAGAAFSLEAAGAERLIVLQELKVGPRPDVGPLIGRIQQSLFAEVGVLADAVLVLAPGRLDRTTSGKVRRRHARDRFARGDLEALGRWCGWSSRPDGRAGGGDPTPAPG